jgi:hypothetical protein
MKCSKSHWLRVLCFEMLDHVDEILVVSDREQHLDIEISLAVLLLHFFQRIEERLQAIPLHGSS